MQYGQALKEYPNEYPGDPHPHAVAGEGGRVVAQFTDIDDARLFVASPELLESLKVIEQRLTDAARAFYGAGKRSALQSALDGWREDAEKARAAIAAATE